MKTSAVLLLTATTGAQSAFVPNVCNARRARSTAVFGYLDDLTPELYAPDDNPDIEKTPEATKMSKDRIDRYGPGDFDDYADFGDEFDGGDGQMGVAGDGNKKLEKIGGGPQIGMKSKTMSAKNAWGTSTGYAEKLREDGMDTQLAQRLENWQNQRAVREKQIAHKKMTEEFDKVREDAEADWRTLAQFGVERVDDFDLDEAFGPVTAGEEIVDTISLTSFIGKNKIHQFEVKNDFMGFADFRAAFTADSSPGDWRVTPKEGALKGSETTKFIVGFRPQNPGISEATLVIDTEDMKKTYKFIGSTGR
jgi:hypothetical protein